MDNMDLFGSLTVNPIELITVLRDFVSAVDKSGYGDRIVLKGGLNLEVALKKYNPALFSRLTVDADFHIRSAADWEDLLKGLDLISSNSKLGIVYSLVDRRGLERNSQGDSATISTSTGHTFDVDMNISLYNVRTERYEDGYLPGYSIATMISDKLKVFLSEKIYRRSKDLYDLYLISHLTDYRMFDIIPEIKGKLDFGDGLAEPLHIPEMEKLAHAYNKLGRITGKPTFEEAYARVLDFTLPVAQAVQLGGVSDYFWESKCGEWRVL